MKRNQKLLVTSKWISLSYSFMFILFLSTGCKDKKDNNIKMVTITVDIDKSYKDIPNIRIDRIIPLELTDSSALSDIYSFKGLIYHNERFYLLDPFKTRALYMFDHDGKFIRRTNTGRGPEEFINPYAFDIDRNKNTLLLFDQRLFEMITLDLDLNLISSLKWDSVPITELRFLPDNKVLIYHDIPKSEFTGDSRLREFYQYTLYEKDFKQPTRLDIIIHTRNSVSFPNPISISNDEVLFTAPWDYSVYKLVDRLAKPAFKIDFGKYMYTSRELKSLSDSEKENMEYSGQRISGMGILQKTNSFLMFLIAFKQEPVTYFHSFTTGNIYCLNDSFEKHLLPTCFTWSAIGENKFLALVNAIEMKAFVNNNSDYGHLTINENDNPYLIIYSITE